MMDRRRFVITAGAVAAVAATRPLEVLTAAPEKRTGMVYLYGRPRGLRYFQPLSHGWVDRDGRIFSPVRDRLATEAIFYLYGRVQWEPAVFQMRHFSNTLQFAMTEKFWQHAERELGVRL